jgi:hypothetical protein
LSGCHVAIHVEGVVFGTRDVSIAKSLKVLNNRMELGEKEENAWPLANAEVNDAKSNEDGTFDVWLLTSTICPILPLYYELYINKNGYSPFRTEMCESEIKDKFLIIYLLNENDRPQ